VSGGLAIFALLVALYALVAARLDRFSVSPAIAFVAIGLLLSDDVLGLVDPLAAAAPDQGCVLRDADLANRALVTRGSTVDLEELGGFGVVFR